MREIRNKYRYINAPHPTPTPSLRVPDHSPPTMLVESGQETGVGVGWGRKNTKDRN